MKSITINVTQEDIDNGVRVDPQSCPIANAILREYKPTWLVVGSNDVIMTKHRKFFWQPRRERYRLPKEAIIFISDFDTNYRPVRPFTFTATEL